jgi:hypothetical protein
MPDLRGRRRAAELKSLQRLDGPVFEDGTPDTLGQLLTAGLHHECLAL